MLLIIKITVNIICINSFYLDIIKKMIFTTYLHDFYYNNYDFIWSLEMRYRYLCFIIMLCSGFVYADLKSCGGKSIDPIEYNNDTTGMLDYRLATECHKLEMHDKAMMFLKQAINKGNVDAMFNMGVYFDRGYGGEQDYDMAAVFYKKAIEHGNDPGAAFNLGLLYQDDKITSILNNLEAADYFLFASCLGHDRAQYHLGLMYLMAMTYSKMGDDAEFWLMQSAKQGNESAQYNLGRMYYHGDVIDTNLVAAQYWFKKAADQGHFRARLYNVLVSLELWYDGQGDQDFTPKKYDDLYKKNICQQTLIY